MIIHITTHEKIVSIESTLITSIEIGHTPDGLVFTIKTCYGTVVEYSPNPTRAPKELVEITDYFWDEKRRRYLELALEIVLKKLRSSLISDTVENIVRLVLSQAREIEHRKMP